MDDICPYFAPLKYPTDDESDSDPSEPSYPSYRVETDPSEPSFLPWFAYHLTRLLLLQQPFVAHYPQFVIMGLSAPMLCLVGVAKLEEEDVVMPLPVVLGTVTSHLMSDVEFACGAEHDDSPFWL